MSAAAFAGKGDKVDSHQQASLTAGTIANDDKFASDLSHFGHWFGVCEGSRLDGPVGYQ